MKCPWCNEEITEVSANVHLRFIVHTHEGNLTLEPNSDVESWNGQSLVKITEPGILQYCWCLHCSKGLRWDWTSSKFIRYSFSDIADKKKKVDKVDINKLADKLSLEQLMELLKDVQSK